MLDSESAPEASRNDVINTSRFVARDAMSKNISPVSCMLKSQAWPRQLNW